MNYEILGSMLKDARSRLKITQSEIASKLGVTFQNVSSWERGKSKIDIDSLATLCDIYGIDFTSALKKANNNSPVQAKAETGELTQDEQELLKDYRQLNKNGKEAAKNAIHGLTYVPNYQKIKDESNAEISIIASSAVNDIHAIDKAAHINQSKSVFKK